MRQKTLSALCLILLLALSLLAVPAAAGEGFDASAMRLARFEGNVQILDAEGVPRFVLENVRFASGETLLTGEDSLASVSLDDSKIVTLDESTAVQFVQEEQHMLLNLLDGQVFIDVSEKLDENATFDIQTTTLTIGIRGTLIFGRVVPGETPGDPEVTTFGVLEGAGQVDTVDASGTRRVFSIAPGEMVTAAGDSEQGASFEVRQMTAADTQGFVQDVANADEKTKQRIIEAIPEGGQQLLLPPEDADLLPAGRVNLYPAGGSWTWSDPVQVVAQSASKLYDGQPLRRPDGALVSGLPESCSIAVSCSGAQTDAGSSANTVDSISIYNIDGEDITGHFTSIEKVEGTLRVDPAPLTVWTGSAEKVYDGEPLTCEDADVKTISGYISEEPVWRNTSIVSRTALGAETMVGVSGTVWVHGSNPLTGEEREIELKTGQRLVVSLSDKDGEESISFTVETLTVQDLPDDVLRLYADNPDLLARACEDVPEWDPAELQARVDGMETAGSTVTQNGLNVHPDMEGDLMTDSSNVRITMDSGVTSYTTQVLTGTVAHFVPVSLDPSIRITATGEQEAVGESENSYEIDWGSANPDNYTVTEDLGTLKVLPLDLELDCGIGKGPAAYDGKALIPWPSIVYRNGPHAGERIYSTSMAGALPARSVSDTRIRAASHTYHFRLFTGDTIDLVISGFGTKPGVYTLTASVTSSSPNLGPVSLSFPGATVVIEPAVLTITTGSAEKVYDGEALTCDEVTVTGLAESDPVTVKAAGRQSDVGSSPNTYTIDWGGVDPACYKIEENLGTLTVKAKNPLAISSPAREKIYDGSALAVTDKEIKVTGLLDGDKIKVSIENAEITNVGSVTPSFRIDWGKVDPKKYDVTETPGKLTVNPNPAVITVTDQSATVTYDGGVHEYAFDVTIEGVPDGFTAKAFNVGQWWQDAGEYTHTSGVLIINDQNYDVTEYFTGIQYVPGTLTVNKRSVTLTSGDASKTYDGTPLTNETVTVSGEGFATGEGATFSTASLTDAGTAPNTITYTLNDNTKAGNYDITTAEGTLTVEKRNVTLTSADATKKYDGSPLTDDTVTLSGDGFITGEGATYSATGTITDAGSTPNTITYTLNDNTKESNYIIIKAEGTLTVTQRSLIMMSRGSSKIYDGTPLTDDYVSLMLGDICAPGESVSVTATGTITDAGSTPNTITYTLSDNAKESNYNIIKSEGTLTVEKRNVTLTSADASKTYDGTPLTSNTVTVGGDGFIPGEGALYSATGTITDAGSTPNTITYTLQSNTKESNYNIIKNEGTLTVNMRNVTLTSASDSKMYDRSPLTNNTVTVGGDGFAPGEGASFSTPSLTDADSITNTITYTLNSNTKACNYNITKNEGTLTVSKRIVIFKSESASKPYDGTPLTYDNVTITGFYVGEVTSVSTPSLTVAGSITNTITYSLNSNIKKSNFEIHIKEGTLTITPVQLKIRTLQDAPQLKVNNTTASLISVDRNEKVFVYSLPTGDTATLDINDEHYSGLMFKSYGLLTIINAETSENRRSCYLVDSPDLEIR